MAETTAVKAVWHARIASEISWFISSAVIKLACFYAMAEKRQELWTSLKMCGVITVRLPRGNFRCISTPVVVISNFYLWSLGKSTSCTILRCSSHLFFSLEPKTDNALISLLLSCQNNNPILEGACQRSPANNQGGKLSQAVEKEPFLNIVCTWKDAKYRWTSSQNKYINF